MIEYIFDHYKINVLYLLIIFYFKEIRIIKFSRLPFKCSKCIVLYLLINVKIIIIKNNDQNYLVLSIRNNKKKLMGEGGRESTSKKSFYIL